MSLGTEQRTPVRRGEDVEQLQRLLSQAIRTVGIPACRYVSHRSKVLFDCHLRLPGGLEMGSRAWLVSWLVDGRSRPLCPDR